MVKKAIDHIEKAVLTPGNGMVNSMGNHTPLRGVVTHLTISPCV